MPRGEILGYGNFHSKGSARNSRVSGLYPLLAPAAPAPVGGSPPSARALNPQPLNPKPQNPKTLNLGFQLYHVLLWGL